MTHTLKDLLKPEQAEALTSIKGKIDRVSGKPASVFTPPEDLVSPADLTGTERLVHAINGTRPGMTLEAFIDAVIDPLTLPEDVIPTRLACPPEPEMGVDIVEINGCQVDLRGDDPWFVTPCVDCRSLTKTLVAPEGVDLSVPREVRCEGCAKAYLKDRNFEVVHHVKHVAKHEPRTKDGIDQPVEVKHIIEKEQDVDLNQYSPAQLATLIERANDIMRTKAEDALRSNVKEAIAANAVEAAENEVLFVADRESRQGLVLPAFEVKGVEVPALDLSEVTDVSMVMNAKQRSPYNKALYRTGGTIVEADKATYEEMAKHHEALRALVEQPKAKAKGKAKAKAVKVTVAVEPEAKAKFSKAQVAALAKVRGISKSEAKALLESV